MFSFERTEYEEMKELFDRLGVAYTEGPTAVEPAIYLDAVEEPFVPCFIFDKTGTFKRYTTV